MKYTKFKAGDKVICVEDCTTKDDTDPNSGGTGWVKDLIFTIGHTNGHDTNDKGFICFGGHNGNGVFAKYLKYATWKNRYKE